MEMENIDQQPQQEPVPDPSGDASLAKKIVSIDNSFNLERPLTRSGKIYLAKKRDKTKKEQCLVIKFIPQQEPSYNTEVVALNMLKNCGHVVKIFQGEIESPGYNLLTLEYMEKGDLVDYFRQNPKKRNDPIIMRSILNQILLAVAEVHGANIVHRDIKMDNFLVGLNETRFPQLKLTDFGLAAILNSEITPYPDLIVRCGTFRYAMPETCYTKDIYKYPHSIDIYATGVTFYYILTGDNTANTPFGFLPKWNTYKLDETIATEHLISLVRKMTFLSLQKRPTITEIIQSVEQNQGSPLEPHQQANTDQNNKPSGPPSET